MRNFLRRFFTPLFLISLFQVSASHAKTPHIQLKEPGVLNVASYSEFKPISYGDGQGYEADLLKAIAHLWQVKIHFHPVNNYEGLWLIPSRQGSISDIAIGGMTPAKYRIREGAVFSNTTMVFSQSLLVRKKDYDSGRIVSYSSFKNTELKIGVVPATTGEQYAIQRAKDNGLPNSVIVQYPSEAELLPALIDGKIDAIARGEIGNEFQAASDKHLITIDKKNYNEGFAFAVDKSNKSLLKNINLAILAVTKNGKITYTQWLENHNVFLEAVSQKAR